MGTDGCKGACVISLQAIVHFYTLSQKSGAEIPHNGRVSKLKADIESRLRILQDAQLVPVRRPKRLGSKSFSDYVDVEAYWDAETMKYWRQSSKGLWEFYDDEKQVFKSADLAWSDSIDCDGPLAKLPDAGICPDTEKALRRLAGKADVPYQTLLKFYLGVHLYAFVKANNGMLKPITVHVSVDKGKLYIVRNTKSRFLSISHFSRMDCSPNCLFFMDREAKANPTLQSAISTIKEQKVVVLWTSTRFAGDTVKGDDGPCLRSKSMCFVIDSADTHHEFVSLLKTMASLWSVDLKIMQ
ncbi:MAG: uncharacterized protein KVP18_000938 [Porospora cf. gigantea A]|uniref:uncharacterized protein n=1 Tax=Porospora cf. gigantea A TaxID=2853593 RepID=UPI00355ACD83|nr:MAG: hypothetical protein KVP18_000938 [Porospora cf. gigantea A]